MTVVSEFNRNRSFDLKKVLMWEKSRYLQNLQYLAVTFSRLPDLTVGFLTPRLKSLKALRALRNNFEDALWFFRDFKSSIDLGAATEGVL